MRLLLPLLIFASGVTFAAPAEKPLGRSVNERFSSMQAQKDLTFDTRQGSVGSGRTFNAGTAQAKSFCINQQFAPGKFEAKEAPVKRSWFGNFKFATKEASTRGRSAIPNADQTFNTKTSDTKQARDARKVAAVSEARDAKRPYLGQESKKLDRAVDPDKIPAAVQNGHVMTLEEIRELLNKNK